MHICCPSYLFIHVYEREASQLAMALLGVCFNCNDQREQVVSPAGRTPIMPEE